MGRYQSLTAERGAEMNFDIKGSDAARRKAGFLCVSISTVMFGLVPSISQLSYKAGLNQFSLLVGRHIISIFLYAMVILIKKESFKVDLKNFKWVMVISFMGISSMLLAYTSYHYLTAGIASLLAAMYIVFVVILEVALRWAKPSIHKFLILLASFSGVVLILWGPGGSEGTSPFGIALGILGAGMYSIEILIMNKKALKDIPLEVIFFYLSIVVVLILPIAARILGYASFPSTLPQWGYASLLALLNSLIAMITFFWAVRLIGAGNASLVGTAEPLVSCVAGVVLMGDVLTCRSVIGGAIIMASVFMLNYIESKKAA